MTLRILDLFCGAGGASTGYARAGFEVVGVDIKPQPHYPFEFYQADAVEVMAMLAERRNDWPVTAPIGGRVDAIHASPPCQLFSRAGKLRDAQGGKSSSIDLLTPMRPLLVRSGLPYVVENVEGAPLRGLVLCGSTFGLGVRRHRIFESNVWLPAAGPCRHKEQGRPWGVYHVPGDQVPSGGRTARDVAHAQEVMGIDWMPKWDELKEAIPPAYTEWVGSQLLRFFGA